jgi:predicted metal-dependent hydrolase
MVYQIRSDDSRIDTTPGLSLDHYSRNLPCWGIVLSRKSLYDRCSIRAINLTEEVSLASIKKSITVEGHWIEVERKRVKHVNFTLYPPEGRVRVSAPIHLSEAALLEVIKRKLPWIERYRARLADQTQRPALAYVSGEQVDYLGERYRLQVIEAPARPQVELGADHIVRLTLRPGSNHSQRERTLIEWYRSQLKALVPPLIAQWEPQIGVQVADWGIKRMKTRWGSCNTQARRIWLNLALARFPISHLEYVIVHEMVHLLERGHNARFYAYLDQFLPGWQAIRAVLKAASTGIPI